MRIPLPKAKCYRVLLSILSIILILIAIDLLWVRIDRRITVGYETTRLVSPLKPDGAPDYLRALNEEASAGVTDDNNAARLLIPLFDPAYILTERVRDGVYAGLHLSPPTHWSADGSTLTRFEPFLKSIGVPESQDTEEYRALKRSRETPWAASDHPHIAQWIARNERAMETLAVAAQRPRYYMPYVASFENRPLFSMTLWPLGDIRSLLWASQSRAMLRFHDGDFAGALNDLRTARQMQMLIMQGVTMIEYINGADMDRDVSVSMRVQGASLTAEQARSLLTLASGFPEIGTCARSLNLERYLVLDSLVFVTRNGAAGQRIVAGDDPQEDFYDKVVRGAAVPFIPSDFNEAMRRQNQLYDRWVFATMQPTYRARVDAGEKLDREMEEQKQRILPALFSDRAERIRCNMYNPVTSIFQWDASVHTQRTLTRTALALAGYHAEHHDYPATLDALIPDWLAALPADPFMGTPLHYVKTPTGYRLYSVGPNGRDDDGHTRDQRDAAHPHPDDIAVTVPPAPPVP